MELCVDQHVSNPERWTGFSDEQPQESDLWGTSSLDLPANLRTWFSDSTLLWWIRQELEHLGAAQPRLQEHLQADTKESPSGMLGILALAFASQIFASDDIAEACRSDRAFQRLCNGRPPFAHELCDYRRRYRPTLERILTGVFTQAIMNRFGLASALLPLELQEDLRAHAAERLDLARHMDAEPMGQNVF